MEKLLDSPVKERPAYLQLEDHLHAVATQRADVVQDQSRDDVDTVGLVGHDAGLQYRQTTDVAVSGLKEPSRSNETALAGRVLPGSPGRDPGSIQ